MKNNSFQSYDALKHNFLALLLFYFFKCSICIVSHLYISHNDLSAIQNWQFIKYGLLVRKIGFLLFSSLKAKIAWRKTGFLQ